VASRIGWRGDHGDLDDSHAAANACGYDCRGCTRTEGERDSQDVWEGAGRVGSATGLGRYQHHWSGGAGEQAPPVAVAASIDDGDGERVAALTIGTRGQSLGRCRDEIEAAGPDREGDRRLRRKCSAGNDEADDASCNGRGDLRAHGLSSVRRFGVWALRLDGHRLDAPSSLLKVETSAGWSGYESVRGRRSLAVTTYLEQAAADMKSCLGARA